MRSIKISYLIEIIVPILKKKLPKININNLKTQNEGANKTSGEKTPWVLLLGIMLFILWTSEEPALTMERRKRKGKNQRKEKPSRISDGESPEEEKQSRQRADHSRLRGSKKSETSHSQRKQGRSRTRLSGFENQKESDEDDPWTEKKQHGKTSKRREIMNHNQMVRHSLSKSNSRFKKLSRDEKIREYQAMCVQMADLPDECQEELG